jgi:hypothetical protein
VKAVHKLEPQGNQQGQREKQERQPGRRTLDIAIEAINGEQQPDDENRRKGDRHPRMRARVEL